MKNLIIMGAGGHGRVVADIAQKLGVYQSIAFLEDRDVETSMGFPVLGRLDEVDKYIDNSDIFVALGNSQLREEIMEKLLTMGATIPTLIHPSAIIGACVEIGTGTAIMAGVVINPCVTIGKGVIVNTCASIDHDCVVGEYCHIAVGVRLAGTVRLEPRVWLGAGSTVKNNVTICAGCTIGAGAVVIDDIDTKGTYIGVPAKLLKEQG